ncbi:ABC transporter ATP-binding protein [Celerinatantimonas diazotrophica]|uniref:Multiple sugar transport system ATP-binding protein n=1 Tax=Celerinatantimonas diazotrophica TaxID=412034 RepID=A0A4R1J9B6_9GAMM|nr:sn-glycerol-3-phosphate ABC transporter ATP-binding protein UgpC [Celerinatantimonas diazotrophica]TCK46689.1 multiple sugar transport system ATP-binding protein [Celerinatantimonas diazotrophica]CAG9295391.1 sn-glycerol-3-phosphate import ATP-binding protein UgpC [Celerinatantimonas diazotrophica]
MANLELCQVSKNYARAQVIKPLDLHIEDGQFTVLVGPSGCGKSTLLRLIAGLEAISGGDISIGSQIVNHIEPAKRDVAMVFQSYALYPHLTVSENMAFHMKSKGVDAATRQKKVAAVAQILDITPLLDRLPKDLSGGQRQRVAMGRAMVRNPKVFLFDEPLSNLDAQLRMELRAEIKSLHQQLKTTIVYVTHDQVEAMTLADKIVVMKDGYIIQQGSPLEIYDQPNCTFVAQFIGSPPMNLLAGTLTQQNDRWVADCQGIRLEVSAKHVANRLSEQPVTLGVRPNQLKIVNHSDHPLATVKVVEMMGDVTLLHLDWQGYAIYLQHYGRFDANPDQQLAIEVNAEAIHLFASDGARL